MKKVVLTFGLIAGLITAGTMMSMVLISRGGQEHLENGEVIGYSSMLIAFILIFFGIRSWRDQNGGKITFKTAFKVGILITLVACAVYVTTWEVYYFTYDQGDFVEHYSARQLEKLKLSGATARELAAERTKMEEFGKLYQNPLVNIGLSFLEIFPVGLIVTLVSAATLRDRPSRQALNAAT